MVNVLSKECLEPLSVNDVSLDCKDDSVFVKVICWAVSTSNTAITKPKQTKKLVMYGGKDLKA